MHANMGMGGHERRDGVRGGLCGKRGAVGRRSRLSFQCEEVEGKLKCSDNRETSSETQTHTADSSVPSYTVSSLKTNMQDPQVQLSLSPPLPLSAINIE